jgi:pyruvate formate lyase activating enzyme
MMNAMVDGLHRALSDSELIRIEKTRGMVYQVQRQTGNQGELHATISLRGCPLSCVWCSEPGVEPLPHRKVSAIGRCMICGQVGEPCGAVLEAGPEGGPDPEQMLLDRVDQCPVRGICMIGDLRSAGDVLRQVLGDAPETAHSGALTFSGGEPTFQPAFTLAVLRLAQHYGLRTVMETSGFTAWKAFERLLPYVDEVVYEIKHISDSKHREFIGVGVQPILNNFAKLARKGAPLRVRVPLIAEFNASMDTLDLILQFVYNTCPQIKEIDLMPIQAQVDFIHSTSESSSYSAYRRLTDEEVQSLVRVVQRHGLRANVLYLT